MNLALLIVAVLLCASSSGDAAKYNYANEDRRTVTPPERDDSGDADKDIYAIEDHTTVPPPERDDSGDADTDIYAIEDHTTVPPPERDDSVELIPCIDTQYGSSEGCTFETSVATRCIRNGRTGCWGTHIETFTCAPPNPPATFKCNGTCMIGCDADTWCAPADLLRKNNCRLAEATHCTALCGVGKTVEHWYCSGTKEMICERSCCCSPCPKVQIGDGGEGGGGGSGSGKTCSKEYGRVETAEDFKRICYRTMKPDGGLQELPSDRGY